MIIPMCKDIFYVRSLVAFNTSSIFTTCAVAMDTILNGFPTEADKERRLAGRILNAIIIRVHNIMDILGY